MLGCEADILFLYFSDRRGRGAALAPTAYGDDLIIESTLLSGKTVLESTATVKALVSNGSEELNQKTTVGSGFFCGRLADLSGLDNRLSGSKQFDWITVGNRPYHS
jgi:hypothetical protein